MKIAIIGGGASGCFAAMRILSKHPDYKVTIFEKSDILLKKIYATGNGRCNFANTSGIENAYNHDTFVEPIIDAFDCDKIIDFFENIGVPHRKIDNLVYPYSLSAATVAVKIEEKLKALKADTKLNSVVHSYKKVENGYLLIVNEKEYLFDKIIFACGGKSSPQLGSDGSIFSILEKHKYHLEPFKPSLCPIKVKENVKKIDGVRARARVTLLNDNQIVFAEDGEVQFRDDAISGLVNFSMAFMIHKLHLENEKNLKIAMDFAPEFTKKINKKDYNSYLNLKLASYLYGNDLDIHNVTFSFKGFYSFKNSHVSTGGVSIKEISNNLESKIEPGIYFAGEMLDVDGKCGGYNLMWAFASAERIASSL